MPETAQLRPETRAYLRDLRQLLAFDLFVHKAQRLGFGTASCSTIQGLASALRARMRRETSEQLAR